MAILKKKQIKEMNKADKEKMLSEIRLELAKDRGQIKIGGSPASTGRVREKRKTIARLLTELNKGGRKADSM